MPWRAIPRYTFAAVEPLPARLVVAHGEPFTIQAKLAGKTVWKPKMGTVQLGSHSLISGKLVGGKYVFAMPSQIDPGSAEGPYRRLFANGPRRTHHAARVDLDRRRRHVARLSRASRSPAEGRARRFDLAR